VSAVTQQIEEKIWNAGMVMAQRFVSAYRDTLLTDSQIVAAMTTDALPAVSFQKTLARSPKSDSRTSNVITMLLTRGESRSGHGARRQSQKPWVHRSLELGIFVIKSNLWY
jgi:hypothetical protein